MNGDDHEIWLAVATTMMRWGVTLLIASVVMTAIVLMR